MKIVGYTRARTQAHRDTQRAEIERWAADHGHEVVGWAEDDGSAFARPADRPALGPWLREERVSFDALVVWSLDRLVRQAHHLPELAARCRVVSVVGDGVADALTWATLASLTCQHADAARFAARLRTGRR